MLLTEEQQSIQEMARRFAQERLAPNAERWDREHHYPADAIAEMAQLGFFGMLVPEEWDGNDSGYVSYAVALEEIAAMQGVSLGRFLSKLHDEVLARGVERRNFAGLLRCACLTYAQEVKGHRPCVEELEREARTDFAAVAAAGLPARIPAVLTAPEKERETA